MSAVETESDAQSDTDGSDVQTPDFNLRSTAKTVATLVVAYAALAFAKTKTGTKKTQTKLAAAIAGVGGFLVTAAPTLATATLLLLVGSVCVAGVWFVAKRTVMG